MPQSRPGLRVLWDECTRAGARTVPADPGFGRQTLLLPVFARRDGQSGLDDPGRDLGA